MRQHSFTEKTTFLLGTFATNCGGGMTVSKLEDRWKATWENNEKLAVLLDEAGIDFMLPIARWVGYGGETDFHGEVLETITWATALLAKTKNINIFATIHTVANHPLVLAKQIATMAKISNDRVGLNIVAGSNKPEYEALGLDLPTDHETRYAYAQEWINFIKKVWTSKEKFDWDGKFFKTKGSYGNPLLEKIPPILNAAGSSQGRAFAINNVNFLFTPAIDLERSRKEIMELKKQAENENKKIGVLTFSHVICRPTEEEALAEKKKILDNIDEKAVDNLVNLQFEHAYSFPHDLLAEIRESMALGHGGFQLVGTPLQVADKICALHEVGFRGTTLSFGDYVKDFPYFRDHVLPILTERGIR